MCLCIRSGTVIGFGISYLSLRINDAIGEGALFLLIGGTFMELFTGGVTGAFGRNRGSINLK